MENAYVNLCLFMNIFMFFSKMTPGKINLAINESASNMEISLPEFSDKDDKPPIIDLHERKPIVAFDISNTTEKTENKNNDLHTIASRTKTTDDKHKSEVRNLSNECFLRRMTSTKHIISTKFDLSLKISRSWKKNCLAH